MSTHLLVQLVQVVSLALSLIFAVGVCVSCLGPICTITACFREWLLVHSVYSQYVSQGAAGHPPLVSSVQSQSISQGTAEVTVDE